MIKGAVYTVMFVGPYIANLPQITVFTEDAGGDDVIRLARVAADSEPTLTGRSDFDPASAAVQRIERITTGWSP